VAAVDSDADNVFVMLSARKLNPSLNIVARPSSDESAAKLEMAGADRTLSPYAVGGRRLASLATQPLIVDFLDIVARGEKGIEFRLEDFGIPEDSFLADSTIGELRIEERTGAMILATRNKEGTFDTTPLRRRPHTRRRHPSGARYRRADPSPRAARKGRGGDRLLAHLPRGKTRGGIGPSRR
jgi:voltage-gated potassium channel